MDETDSPSPKESLLDLQEIRQIVDLMAQNELSYFNLEVGSFKIKLRRGSDVEAARELLAAMPVPPAVAAPPVAPAAGPALAENAFGQQPAAPEVSKATTINSPMVGTFYRSSSPGEKPYISIGDTVDEGTTVCIIEAMKVMNEIKAEVLRGTISKVLVEEGKPVQYGQPLFELK